MTGSALAARWLSAIDSVSAVDSIILVSVSATNCTCSPSKTYSAYRTHGTHRTYRTIYKSYKSYESHESYPRYYRRPPPPPPPPKPPGPLGPPPGMPPNPGGRCWLFCGLSSAGRFWPTMIVSPSFRSPSITSVVVPSVMPSLITRDCGFLSGPSTQTTPLLTSRNGVDDAMRRLLAPSAPAKAPLPAWSRRSAPPPAAPGPAALPPANARREPSGGPCWPLA